MRKYKDEQETKSCPRTISFAKNGLLPSSGHVARPMVTIPECSLSESDESLEALSPLIAPGLTRRSTFESSGATTPTSFKSFWPLDRTDLALKEIVEQLWNTGFPKDLDINTLESSHSTSRPYVTCHSSFGGPLAGSEAATEEAALILSDNPRVPSAITREDSHAFAPLQVRYSSLGVSIPRPPPRFPRQLADRQGFSLSVKGIRSRCAATGGFEGTNSDRKKNRCDGISWAGYGNRSCGVRIPSSDAPDVSHQLDDDLVGEQQDENYPVHPSEMVGEGSYRISRTASINEMVETFRKILGPMAPLVAKLAGRDAKVPGHQFTYDDLQRMIYQRETCSRVKPGLSIMTTDEGVVVQSGFPADKVTKSSDDSDHLRGQWWEIVPTLKEHKIAHLRTAPVSHTPEIVARVKNEVEDPMKAHKQRERFLPQDRRVRFAEPPRRRDPPTKPLQFVKIPIIKLTTASIISSSVSTVVPSVSAAAPSASTAAPSNK